MTKEEYINKKETLKREYEKECKKLTLDYCMSKTPYSVGDIVEDHIGVGRIDSIGGIWNNYIGSNNVSLWFCCTELRKSDLTPKKNNAVREVYEDNIKKIVKKNGE